MDTYFIHSAISQHFVDNWPPTSTSLGEQKEPEYPWFVAKNSKYPNVVDIKAATLKIKTPQLLDRIKKSYPMIFSNNRIHIDRGVDEDSVSEVEVVVKANNKHLSSTQISKICDIFLNCEKVRAGDFTRSLCSLLNNLKNNKRN